MGGMFESPKKPDIPPPVVGPTEEELKLEAEAAASKQREEDMRKKRRGHRALLATSPTGLLGFGQDNGAAPGAKVHLGE